MLNEIFKGMDNAAEQINENFQNGSIIETGENENGSYIKYSNGWKICTFKGLPLATNNTEGALFRSSSTTWTFPIPFEDKVIPFANVNNVARFATTHTDNLTTVAIRQYGFVNSDTLVDTGLFAIGR